MNKQSAVAFTMAFFALMAAAGLKASPDHFRSAAEQTRGARQLMDKLHGARTLTALIPLMSNRSAAEVGIMYASMGSEMVSGSDQGAPVPVKKLTNALAAIDRRFGVEPTSAPVTQLSQATKHGRAFTMAVMTAISVNMTGDTSHFFAARPMPPARAYNYSVEAPGRLRVSLISGKNFPGLAQSYAQAVWEDGAWRLDLGTASWTQ